jgi:hypothetical protein
MKVKYTHEEKMQVVYAIWNAAGDPVDKDSDVFISRAAEMLGMTEDEMLDRLDNHDYADRAFCSRPADWKCISYHDKFVPALVGGMSLVGVGSKRPTSWGNYFWLRSGQRIANFWAENLEDAVGKFLPDGLVKIRDYGDVAIIIDKRIPQDYFYNKLCFTGFGRVDTAIIKNMYDFLGDPENAFEEYSDPVAYHAKKGNHYDPKTGTVWMKIEPKAKAFRGEWTVGVDQDLEAMHGLDVDDPIVLGYKGDALMEPYPAQINCPYIPQIRDDMDDAAKLAFLNMKLIAKNYSVETIKP